MRPVLRVVTSTTHRPLKEIALLVFKDWLPVSPHARPYLDAMLSLDQIEDCYGLDSAMSVVSYFLANASGWRGETARRIKAELKKILKNVDHEAVAKNHQAAYAPENNNEVLS